MLALLERLCSLLRDDSDEVVAAVERVCARGAAGWPCNPLCNSL